MADSAFVGFSGWDDAVLNMTLGEKSILTITGYVYFAHLNWTGECSIHSRKSPPLLRLFFARYFHVSTSSGIICEKRNFVARSTNSSACLAIGWCYRDYAYGDRYVQVFFSNRNCRAEPPSLVHRSISRAKPLNSNTVRSIGPEISPEAACSKVLVCVFTDSLLVGSLV